jgi:glutathione synthase/RimK-type ligase-like ATP-grasp enzyme
MALKAIGETLGLEFCGVDCALDRQGDLVVFEANATMCVHQHNPDFPYKTPHVKRIKEAFDSLLARQAGGESLDTVRGE